MTYQRREYVLGDKLKSEFRERGKDVSGIRASSTSELMNRATNGHDPRGNCAEEAFRESYVRRASSNTQRSRRINGMANVHRNVSSQYAAKTQKKIGQTGYSARRAGVKSAQAMPKTVKHHAVAQTIPQKPKTEIKDNGRKMLSPMFVAILSVATVMVMFLVTQISDVYRVSNEIAQLENKLSTMQTEADELKLKLDEKNDIREIERIATTELGMAKEDTMQRRYITLSDGERIDVIDNGEDEETAGGIILSSIASAIEKLFD